MLTCETIHNTKLKDDPLFVIKQHTLCSNCGAIITLNGVAITDDDFIDLPIEERRKLIKLQNRIKLQASTTKTVIKNFIDIQNYLNMYADGIELPFSDSAEEILAMLAIKSEFMSATEKASIKVLLAGTFLLELVLKLTDTPIIDRSGVDFISSIKKAGII